ncbi:unnamed protein product, partial [marine sediment metagenome]
ALVISASDEAANNNGIYANDIRQPQTATDTRPGRM